MLLHASLTEPQLALSWAQVFGTHAPMPHTFAVAPPGARGGLGGGGVLGPPRPRPAPAGGPPPAAAEGGGARAAVDRSAATIVDAAAVGALLEAGLRLARAALVRAATAAEDA